MSDFSGLGTIQTKGNVTKVETNFGLLLTLNNDAHNTPQSIRIEYEFDPKSPIKKALPYNSLVEILRPLLMETSTLSWLATHENLKAYAESSTPLIMAIKLDKAFSCLMMYETTKGNKSTTRIRFALVVIPRNDRESLAEFEKFPFTQVKLSLLKSTVDIDTDFEEPDSEDDGNSQHRRRPKPPKKPNIQFAKQIVHKDPIRAIAYALHDPSYDAITLSLAIVDDLTNSDKKSLVTDRELEINLTSVPTWEWDTGHTFLKQIALQEAADRGIEVNLDKGLPEYSQAEWYRLP